MSIIGKNHPFIHRTQALSLVLITTLLSTAISSWISQGLRLVHIRLPLSVMAGVSLIVALISLCFKETRGLPTAEIVSKGKSD